MTDNISKEHGEAGGNSSSFHKAAGESFSSNLKFSGGCGNVCEMQSDFAIWE